MARKCVCQICKAKGTTDSFYKVYESGKNKYYCNKNEYDEFMNEKEKRNKLIEYIATDILTLEDGQIVNPIMIKKITNLNGFYDYDVILECFKLNKETIHYWMNNKNFSNEYGMISYMMKIIEGNINDVHKQWKFKKQQEIKVENKKLDLDIINEIETVAVIKTNDNNGILDFLDEGDM